MRIVLDLQACQASSKHRGIGRYSMALAQAMVRRGGAHELLIALNSHYPDAIGEVRAAFDGLLPQTQIRVYDLPGPLAEYDKRNAWRVRAAEQLREHYFASLAPDFVHVASLFEGLGENAAASVAHGDGSFDTAVTLYDLIPLLRKDVYLAEAHVARWYYRKLQSLKNAELLLAISGHSRLEAMSALQLPGERVVNISSAVGPEFHPRVPDDGARREMYARFGLRGDFIMYTGGIDFRKNIEGLIEAYALLPGTLRARYQLAVVCSIQDHDRVRLQRVVAKFGLPKDDVVFTGYVSDQDLVALYNSTTLFVFPSLQEGFGLPALEAMSCGAPTIGSNNSSIPEVIGRADALFDPTSVRAIADKMNHVLTDRAFADSLSAHGLVQAREFSWDASAQRAIAAFEETHARNRPRIVVPVDAPSNRPDRRPRMAYVSPLPPERSGIADYSAELVPELARYYDIDVIVAQEQVSDVWVNSNFPQRSAEWFDQHAHEYDRVMYHFGNSSFHQHMFDLLERHPGIVVLHDFFMSGIVHYAEAASPYPNNYCRVLYQSHGYRALLDVQDMGLERSIYEYPCNKAVLDQAAGVIVHSSYSMTLADQWYGAGAARDWALIPLLRVLPPALDRTAARKVLGIADDDFVVCSFGRLDVTKCNERILEAWLGSTLAADQSCHLAFVGENNVLQWGHDLVARMEGTQRIRITGFASQEMYRHYLAAADVAVQLRTRSRGETSAAVLDCLAYRLPTIINAHGSAAEVPAEVTIKLPDVFTDAELAAAMLRLHADRALAQELSRKAAAYMDEVHHPARIGAMYRDVIEQFQHSSPRLRYKRLLASLAAIPDAIEPAGLDLPGTAACIAANGARSGPRQLLLDVSDLARAGTMDGAHAQLVRDLVDTPPDGYRVEPVTLADGVYRYARRFTLDLLGRPELVLADAPAEIKGGDHLLLLGAGEADPMLALRGVTSSHADTGVPLGAKELAAWLKGLGAPAESGQHAC
jgi:glycosyltransferase involved in cell wall biosynthesis